MHDWHPESWKSYRNYQPIPYKDPHALLERLSDLKTRKALVSLDELTVLKMQLIEAKSHHRFFIHVGDCAEAFKQNTLPALKAKTALFATLKSTLEPTIQKPVTVIGRMAGQYAKPRTQLQCNQTGLHAFRGELINGAENDFSIREPAPSRLHQAYIESQKCIQWLKEHPGRLAYGKELFISHEALHLPYESALTRNTPWHNAATHMLWVGMRTAFPDSAHIEYLSGLKNPKAIKVGPNLSPKHLLEVVKKSRLYDKDTPLILILRLGRQAISQSFAPILKMLAPYQQHILWFCDPMHGNTITRSDGQKTRVLTHIKQELSEVINGLAQHQQILSGIHLECTSDDVIECVNTSNEINRTLNYRSLVDPRLNPEQALEVISHLKQPG